MTSQTRATLKGYFNTNDQPTEAQFVDLIDSAVNATDDPTAHVAITLDANADALLSLSAQALGLDTQAANVALAGPATGAAAVPTFRALTIADLPMTSIFALFVVSNGAILTSNGALTWQS